MSFSINILRKNIFTFHVRPLLFTVIELGRDINENNGKENLTEGILMNPSRNSPLAEIHLLTDTKKRKVCI